MLCWVRTGRWRGGKGGRWQGEQQQNSEGTQMGLYLDTQQRPLYY